MKRFFIIGLLAVMMFSVVSQCAIANSASTAVVKKAITEYKTGNYLGCISDLRMYLEEDSSNVVAWYYLGNAYMKIAMKPEAHEAFDMVINLNSVPKLTSYAIQAKMCMENTMQCTYQDFTNEEIKELRADPAGFLTQYFTKLNEVKEKDADVVEIEKLIQGGYSNNVHPDAQNFIMQQKTQTKQNQMNKSMSSSPSKAAVPSDEKLAEAIMLLKQQRDNDITSMAMFLDNDYENMSSKKSADYTDLIQYYQNNGKKVTPEMLRYSMMEKMMPNF